jgi:hypothetical protein
LVARATLITEVGRNFDWFRGADVRLWHKADMLNALTNVRFWEQTGHLTNPCLPISIYEYTA